MQKAVVRSGLGNVGSRKQLTSSVGRVLVGLRPPPPRLFCGTRGDTGTVAPVRSSNHSRLPDTFYLRATMRILSTGPGAGWRPSPTRLKMLQNRLRDTPATVHYRRDADRIIAPIKTFPSTLCMHRRVAGSVPRC